MEWMKSEASLVAETGETRQLFFVFLRFFLSAAAPERIDTRHGE
jgi:hypothetical protein